MHSFSNSAEKGNGGFAYFAKCTIYINSELNSNRALNGGAIYAERGSNIHIYGGNTTIANNLAHKNGGGLYLDESILTLFTDYDSLIFSNNVAKQQGGAIYVPDKNCETGLCFLQDTGTQQHLIFMNNTATHAGSYSLWWYVR